MDHPILVIVFLHRAPVFYCIDNRSEIACRDFPRMITQRLVNVRFAPWRLGPAIRTEVTFE
jgi:hypothetical protein